MTDPINTITYQRLVLSNHAKSQYETLSHFFLIFVIETTELRIPFVSERVFFRSSFCPADQMIVLIFDLSPLDIVIFLTHSFVNKKSFYLFKVRLIKMFVLGLSVPTSRPTEEPVLEVPSVVVTDIHTSTYTSRCSNTLFI